MKREGKEMEGAVKGTEITAGAAQAIFDVLCEIYCRTRPIKQRIIVLDEKEPKEKESEEDAGPDGQAEAS